MSSSTRVSSLADRFRTRRTATILTAIGFALPIAYGFRTGLGGAEDGASFLLLMTLAVGVPTAYDQYWPREDRLREAIAWVIVACLVATVEFTALYRLGLDYAALGPFWAAVVAFLGTELGNAALLVAWNRTRQPTESAAE